MSNRKKLPKEKPTTDYTIEDFIDDESQKWADFVESIRLEAALKGEHGVMVIGTEKAFICEYVPYGKIFHARDQEAFDKFVANKLGK